MKNRNRQQLDYLLRNMRTHILNYLTKLNRDGIHLNNRSKSITDRDLQYIVQNVKKAIHTLRLLELEIEDYIDN